MKESHDVSKLDRIDYRILEALQTNGRLPITRLAAFVSLSVSPCWQRVKRLEKAGIIRRYTADIAVEKLRSIQIVIAQVILTKHSREAYAYFERQVRSIPEVIECYEVTGHVDYHLKFIVANIERYKELVEKLIAKSTGVEKYFTYVVTRTSKDERAIRMSDIRRMS